MSVELHINGHRSECSPGDTLFDCAERLGIRVPTSCRKQGKCKECLVEIADGQECLSPREEAEAHLGHAFRLSCCCKVVATTGVVRCHTMRRGAVRIERHALHLPVQQTPLVPDPAVSRDGDRILLDGQQIDCSSGPMHGLAMDLGTTTVVLRLLNLETGEIVADASFENPQRFGGSDVMSRIHYDTQDGTGLLRRTLTAYVRHAIEEFPVKSDSIYEMVVVGNSTMRDILFGLNPHSIGQTPYRSVTEVEMAEGRRRTTSLKESASCWALPLHPKARVYGLPIISGHVGADAAACMLAVDLAHEDRVVAVMDLGTNTELIVGNRHRILAASCPAGPAFEGGAIACGLPALPGAIEQVVLRADGAAEVRVIGGGLPEGICGSGLIQLLSELLRTGRMNALGRFRGSDSRILVCPGKDQPVYLSERDVSELSKAKGANVAGLHVVFDEYGIRFEEVDLFYLAGAFGRHLDIQASKRIGLIPNIPDSKFVRVGNASIEGACIALLSRTKREELESLVKRVVHCRLEAHPRFFDYFVEGCQFNRVESTPPVTPTGL